MTHDVAKNTVTREASLQQGDGKRERKKKYLEKEKEVKKQSKGGIISLSLLHVNMRKLERKGTKG